MTVQGRLRDDRSDGLRVGLTVTRRVGHATERNRIKRRLRTVFQQVGPEHAGANVDVVIIARRDSLTVEFGVLLDDLARALRTVIKPKSPRRPDAGPAAATSPSSANRVQT
jgi:ribonuclease P protein component